MAKMRSWVKAARLRTLPLALSSIAMGGFVAATHTEFNMTAVIFAALTTLFLQILSNLANDFGDTKSGIDNKNRLGPMRTVQSGEIGQDEMKKAIILFSFLSLLSGILLIFWAAEIPLMTIIIFLLIGLGAIGAAINYTIGKNPYGYKGFGDVFVFLFFGLAGVGGTYFLATSSMDFLILLPAAAMGLWSAGVLNLNNMRDIDNDKSNGKKTLVVLIGYRNALIYHSLLVLFPFVLLIVFMALKTAEMLSFAFLIGLPLFVIDLLGIIKIQDQAQLDPFLKKLALKSLLVTLLFGISLLI